MAHCIHFARKIARWLLPLAGCWCVTLSAAELQVHVMTPDGNPVEHAVVEILTQPPGPTPSGSPANAIMDQINKEFVGPVLAVAAGTLVEFPNSDDVHHHVYSFSDAKRFELPLYTGNIAAPVLFDTPGVVTLGCNIHDWMVGYIYVSGSSLFGLSDANGMVILRDINPGEHRLTIWHNSLPAGQALPEHAVSVSATGTTGTELTLETRTLRTIRRAPLPGTRAY